MESPQRDGRVVLFEDDPEIRKLVYEAFAESPHSIIEDASSHERAHLLVSLILAELLEVDVAIIGGRLGPNNTGEEIVRLLQGTGVRTIGYSGLSLENVDIDYGKDKNVWDLPDVVTNLLIA